MTAADMPLPEPSFSQVGVEQGTDRRVTIHNYTADQMRTHRKEYAAARVAEVAGPLVEALLYYRDHCTGAEPSLSVFHRMLDAALAAEQEHTHG